MTNLADLTRGHTAVWRKLLVEAQERARQRGDDAQESYCQRELNALDEIERAVEAVFPPTADVSAHPASSMDYLELRVEPKGQPARRYRTSKGMASELAYTIENLLPPVSPSSAKVTADGATLTLDLGGRTFKLTRNVVQQILDGLDPFSLFRPPAQGIPRVGWIAFHQTDGGEYLLHLDGRAVRLTEGQVDHLRMRMAAETPVPEPAPPVTRLWANNHAQVSKTTLSTGDVVLRVLNDEGRELALEMTRQTAERVWRALTPR